LPVFLSDVELVTIWTLHCFDEKTRQGYFGFFGYQRELFGMDIVPEAAPANRGLIVEQDRITWWGIWLCALPGVEKRN